MQRVGRVIRVAAVALGIVAMVACSTPPGTSVEATAAVSGGPDTAMIVASYPRHPNEPRSHRRRPHRKRSGDPLLDLERREVCLDAGALCPAPVADRQLDPRILEAAARRLGVGRRSMDLLNSARQQSARS